jgi:hypothetical protein
MNLARPFLFLCAVVLAPVVAWSQTSKEIEDLQQAKMLLDAQAARDTAEAAALKAAADLAKAKAAAAEVANDIEKAQYDAAAALKKSQIASETATLDALKTTFGAPPTVGTDGNISITDAASGVLLEVKAGSLRATMELADQLCAALKDKNVVGAFFAPVDLDAKIQSARLVLREFDALTAKVNLKANKDLVGIGDVAPQVTPAAALGAVSLLQYGAGALQTVAKMFRSDLAIGLSADATRGAWLEYFVSSKCPTEVPRVQLEAAVRNQSIDVAMTRLNDILEFSNAAASTKSGIQFQIQQMTARIEALKKEKQPTAALEAALAEQQKLLAGVTQLDSWLPRLTALISTVSTTPAVFLDALTWAAFGDATNPLMLANKPRLVTVLTTQDGQVTKTFWLTGKKVYGRSSAELTFRLVDADGTVKSAGFLTATVATGTINFGSNTPPAAPRARPAPQVARR